MTIADGRGRGRVTIRWAKRTTVINRLAIMQVTRGGMMPGDLEVEFSNTRRSWFLSADGVTQETVDAVAASLLDEDVDVVWDFRGDVPRRTPDALRRAT